MTRHCSPVLRVFSGVTTALLLIAILGPFFQVLQGALFQGTGFSLEAVYKVFLATPEYLLVFRRTIALCALMVGGQVVLSVLAGLGFAKYDFPGKKLWFFLLLVVMVLPLQVTLVPNFRILGTLNLLDTQWALMLPALFAPLGTFLMTQSFRAVPDEILEAAQLDGASTFTILWRVLVPCGKNGLACVIVLTFLEAWNMVEQPMAYLKEPAQYPLSVSLATTGARDQAVQLACCLLALLPPLLLFLGLHKELVQGIALQEDWAGESRHRGFFRALAITLAILVECTILSGMISREMAVQVTVASPRHDQERAADSLPLDAFRQEEDGTFLYLLEEGTGLLGSTQLRRVSTDILSLEGERAFTTGLEQRGSYVVYASRPLEDEALAVELVPSDPAPDTYLLWAPEGIELDAPSAPIEGGTLYLLPQEESPQPFLEERELAALLSGEERENCRLFSLGDVEQFTRQLLLLGGVGVLALAPLVFCAGLCLSIGKRGKWKAKALWCLLLAASLAGLFLLLGQVALPSSLMPSETFFDLDHYSETFQLLRNGLSAFSDSDLCRELGALLSRQKTAALAIFLGGCIALSAGLLLGMGYKRRKTFCKEKIR
ncbi:MAG TPA: carbohydrate ABC transporter permease [Candidatus Acutalibacter stercoravium]|nr:carbohydrate ABC transporter permease [Candidatus Acutalibacter stercoravium]